MVYLKNLELVLHLGSNLRERLRHHFARPAPPVPVGGGGGGGGRGRQFVKRRGNEQKRN